MIIYTPSPLFSFVIPQSLKQLLKHKQWKCSDVSKPVELFFSGILQTFQNLLVARVMEGRHSVCVYTEWIELALYSET